jgi:hypothetical protein
MRLVLHGVVPSPQSTPNGRLGLHLIDKLLEMQNHQPDDHLHLTDVVGDILMWDDGPPAHVE